MVGWLGGWGVLLNIKANSAQLSWSWGWAWQNADYKKQDDESTTEDDEETTNLQNTEYESDNIVLGYPTENDEDNTESKSNQTYKKTVGNQNESSDSGQKEVAPKKETSTTKVV